MGKVILISNPDEEAMYNELYGFKEWLSRSFNLISFKLEKGVNLDISKLMSYFDKPFSFQDVDYDLRNERFDVTAFMVRRGKNSYQIYIPQKYVFQDFCRDVLLETWYRVSIYENLPSTDKEARPDTKKAGELYDEIRRWFHENAADYDCLDSPYIDRYGSYESYQAKTILRTLNGELVERILNTFNQRVDEIQAKCVASETSWMRSTYGKTYLSLEVVKREFVKEEDNDDD